MRTDGVCMRAWVVLCVGTWGVTFKKGNNCIPSDETGDNGDDYCEKRAVGLLSDGALCV